MKLERLQSSSSDRFDKGETGRAVRTWHAVAVGALAMTCASALVHFVPPGVDMTKWGDNERYIGMVQHLLVGDSEVENLGGWGYPAVAGLVSSWTHISTMSALTIVSVSSALGAVALASQLCGPRVAATFAIVNFSWLQRATFGGTESLYMLFLLSGLVCVRHNRWITATALASLSVLVRPVGIFALPAIFIVLAARKEYRTLALSFACASTIGISYFILVRAYIGDPILSISSYHNGWYGDWIVTFPLKGVVAALREFDRPWWSALYQSAWLTMPLATILVVLIVPGTRLVLVQYPVEWIFVGFYLTFLLCYNSYWVWLDAARLLVPVMPFMLAAFKPWLPHQIWFYLVAAPLLGIASGVPVIGVANILGMFP